MALLDLHFAPQLAEIEARLAKGADPAEAFRGLDDDLFALISGKDYAGHDAVKAALPDYPDNHWISNCTGNHTLHDAVQEASLFWRLAKEAYAAHGRRGPLATATVADYGAGWGRITRFCPKDAGRVVAIEPNETFHEIWRQTRVPGELVASDFLSKKKLPVSDIDLLICFSILTHASDALAKNIAKRWAEIVAPGGVVLFTVRPGTYLDLDGGEIDRLSPADKAAARSAYEAGRIAYWPYPECPSDWGVTVMPMAYLEQLFGRHFEIIGPRYFLQNHTQLPIVMVRRQGGWFGS